MKEFKSMSPYELGETGQEEAIRYLIIYISKGRTNDKRLAASAINKLTENHYDACRKAIPFLIENLSDTHPQLRQYTLKALRKFSLKASDLKVIKHIYLNDSAEYNKKIAEEILLKAKEEIQAVRVQDSVLDDIHTEKEKFAAEFSLNKLTQKEAEFIEIINRECGIRFTEKQKAAVIHKDGPALVLAVPGAGKTTVLLSRTANLIVNHGINPANILSITFSKASAIDMRNRYNQIFSNITSIGANFSTIHSFCFELIKKYSSMNNINYTVIEDPKAEMSKRMLLKSCYKSINGEVIDEDALDELINSISYVKNMMFTQGEITTYSKGLDINKFNDIYEKYEGVKKEKNYLDYDDMLSLSYEILNKDEALLNRYRNLYKYIQVDEAQDTSKLQHKIIQTIASPNNNIFMVADDDQSIYSFRGAFPKFLLEIDNLYPQTKRFYIEENFRSTKEIVSLANSFIKNNEVRFNKELFTNNISGKPVNVLWVKDEKEQTEFLISEINSNIKSKNKVILYRNNMTSIILAEELSRRGVSFYLKDYNRFFFRHFVLEDIKALFIFTDDNSSIEAFMRIYYRTNSFIKKQTAEALKNKCIQNKSIFDIIDGVETDNLQKRNLLRMKEIFIRLKDLKPWSVIDYFENELNYNRYLKDNAKLLGYSYEGLRAILINIKALAARCLTLEEFRLRVKELESIMENSTKRNKDAEITLSTIHSSKGLEFSKVYMIDLFENIIPNRTSVEKYEIGDKEPLEEERRLMYVAMTRARAELTLVVLNKKNDETMTPSRFVSELQQIFNKNQSV